MNDAMLLARLIAEFPGCDVERGDGEIVVRQGSRAWPFPHDVPWLDGAIADCRAWFQYR